MFALAACVDQREETGTTAGWYRGTTQAQGSQREGNVRGGLSTTSERLRREASVQLCHLPEGQEGSSQGQKHPLWVGWDGAEAMRPQWRRESWAVSGGGGEAARLTRSPGPIQGEERP